VATEKAGRIKIYIDGFKSTQFTDFVENLAVVRKYSLQVPVRNHDQFGTNCWEMINATLKIAAAVILTQGYQAKLVHIVTACCGFGPHTFYNTQDLGARLLDHQIRTNLTDTDLVHTNHLVGRKTFQVCV